MLRTPTKPLGHPAQPSPSCSADVFEQALREHAYELGIDLDTEPQFKWIAEESLVAPLEDGWVQIKQEDGDYAGSLYYYNEYTQASQWEHPSDDHFRAVIELERGKQSNKSQELYTARSAWDEDSPTLPPPIAHTTPHLDHENGNLREQCARLENKLASANAEASSKSKALQALRLAHDTKQDDLERAKRDLGLMHDHLELREAALIQRKRDWHEVVDEIKVLMADEGDKHVRILLAEALQGLDFGFLTHEQAADLQAQLRSAEEASKVAQAAALEDRSAKLRAEAIASETQARLLEREGETEHKQSSATSESESSVLAELKAMVELRDMVEKSSNALKHAELRACQSEERLAEAEKRAKQDRVSYEGRALSAESELAATTRRLQEAEHATSTLQEKLEGRALSAESELAASTRRIQEAEHATSTLKVKLAVASQAQSLEASAAEGNARDELELLRTSSQRNEEALRSETSSLRKDLAEARAALARAQEQATEATRGEEKTSAEVQTVSSQLGKAKERQDKLKGDKKKLEAMTKELHSELKFALETGEALHGDLDAARADAESVRANSAAALRRVEESDARMAAAEIEKEGVVSDLAVARAAATEAAREKERWQEMFTDERQLRQKLGRKITDIQGNIRVICRIRPLSTGEDDPCVEVLDSERMLLASAPHSFEAVFGATSTQDAVFAEVQPTVMSALDGFNVTIFAYGQTGSGKTYTMEGPPGSRGVNFRALEELFNFSASSVDTDFRFSMSMLEVYNEAVRDLLGTQDGEDTVDLEIRVGKGARGGPSVYVEGLAECDVSAMSEVEHLMRQGSRSRATASNNVNEHSSRSHLVLTLKVVATRRDTGLTTHGKLNLIDLAGSERLKSTNAEGQRLKEAQNINRSLSALGDVVAALGRSGAAHIPYRNSKLTFLLQDSLSANSRVLMFVNVAPAFSSADESKCSLAFAGRCRAVQLGAAKKTVRASSASRGRGSSRAAAEEN